jgi:hypothetical protein
MHKSRELVVLVVFVIVRVVVVIVAGTHELVLLDLASGVS